MRLAGSVKLRPVRIGFLIPPDDLTAVRRVARLCTCLWGGRYNPMIPFLEDAPRRWGETFRQVRGLDMTRGYVDFFEPDVLVESSKGMANKLGWVDKDHPLGLPRVVALDEFYTVNYRGWPEFPAGIDIVNVIHQLYNDDYKYQHRHKVPFAITQPADGDAFFDVCLGCYPDDSDLKYIADSYRRVFEPEQLQSNAETSLRLIKEPFPGPLWITRHGLEEALGRGLSDETIFIFDPADAGDVIDYWNYRLVHRRVRPVSVRWLAEHAAFLREFIETGHRPIPGNPSGLKFHTNVHFGSSMTDPRMMDLARQHFANLPQGSCYIGRGPMIWPATKSGDLWRLEKILVGAQSVAFDEQISADRYVKIPALVPEFHNAARAYTRSHWINVIAPTSADDGEGAATVYPSNLWQPGYPRLATGGYDVVVTREGWTIPKQHSTGYSLLEPTDGREALIGWFKANGIEGRPSEEGQVAAQIIAAAGSLLACGMFADAKTLELLNGMAESHAAPSRGGERVRAVSPDRAMHVNSIREHFDKRSKRSFGYWNHLDYFLKRSVFRAGLRVQCPTCGHYNWFDLNAISYAPTCSRCLKEFKFPEAPANLHEVKWFYRVIGPFAAPDYARGGYAVALTLRCMEERHDTEMTWSTGLVLDTLNCEIDFTAWYRRGSMFDDEREEPILIVGEAKSFGKNAIDDDAIASLRQVAERFPGAMMVVSSLRPISDYLPIEIQRMTELAEWGRLRTLNGRPRNPLIVLTGTELFCEHGIRQAWKDAGGRAAQMVAPAAVDFTDLHQLAEATQHLYLGMPSFHQYYRDRLRQRARLLWLIRSRSNR
jgi:hypothetical protein